MELMLCKDGVYKQELFIQYEVHENKFFFERFFNLQKFCIFRIYN
jgi:hypothetical protein